MGRNVDLYFTYLRLALRSLAQYRADFALLAGATVLREGATLAFIGLVFNQLARLQGWSLYEVVLIYGLVITARFLCATFLNVAQEIARYIATGQLDTVLVRPTPPLLTLIGETCFNPVPLGSIAVGLAAIGIALARVETPVQWWWFPYLAATIAGGTLLNFALLLLAACAAFWFTSVSSVLFGVDWFGEFAQFPVGIYATPLQVLLTWVLPYAMVGYYPAVFLLRGDAYRAYGLVAPFVGVALTCLALVVWRFALRRYQSTGS